MALNYKPLWIQLAKKGLKKTDVIAMAQMGKDKPITLKNLERICKALDCTPNDVFSFDDEYVEEREQRAMQTKWTLEDDVNDYVKGRLEDLGLKN